MTTTVGVQPDVTRVIAGKEVPLNKLLSFSVKRDEIPIPEENRMDVTSLLIPLIRGSPRDRFDCETFAQNQKLYADLLKDIEWKWIFDGKKLPKRIEKYVKEKYRVTLSPETLTRVGDLASKNIPTTTEYNFDFSTTMHWRGGDFGDPESCFQNSEGKSFGSVAQMEEDGRFLAVRFYKNFGLSDELESKYGINKSTTNHHIVNDDIYLGNARAWIHTGSTEKAFVFNGYGYQTPLVAEITAQYLARAKKTVEVYSGVCNNYSAYMLTDPSIKNNITSCTIPEGGWRGKANGPQVLQFGDLEEYDPDEDDY